jgi:hypothetical protein
MTAAQALGRRGGSANTAAQNEARGRNALKGGRRPDYRLEPVSVSKDKTLYRLEHRDGDEWSHQPTITASAMVFLWRQLQDPARVVVSFADGIVTTTLAPAPKATRR